MVSIPHIRLIEERNEYVNDFPKLPDLSPEEKEKVNKKILEIRSSLKNKFSMEKN